jgi:hypothetical protein
MMVLGGAMLTSVPLAAGDHSPPPPKQTPAPMPETPPATFTLFLKAGTFYGPGDKGVHQFNNAEVRSIVLTGPLNGFIPFFNNGAELPNVIAEVLQGATVDGYTSDGRPINENIDTGLRLILPDTGSGESANIMVVSVEQEIIQPDAKGNLVFEAHVVADPGPSAPVAPFDVRFTSGAVRIPLSLKTQRGLAGGHDFAGPFASGHVLIGRIGDFDHDGYLDGELVQGENAPLELIAARGDPLAQRRPWVSNIPSTPPLSALLNLNGIVQNFPEPLLQTLTTGQVQNAVDYAFDINGRLNAALYDLNAILSSPEMTHRQKLRAHAARLLVRQGRQYIEHGLDILARGKASDGKRHRGVALEAGSAFQRGLKLLGLALQQVSELVPPQAPQIDLSSIAEMP